jgi:hypothetical protein
LLPLSQRRRRMRTTSRRGRMDGSVDEDVEFDEGGGEEETSE